MIDGVTGATPVPMFVATVTWTHTPNPNDPPNSLIGYRVIIYDSVNDPTAGSPLFDSGLIADPTRRAFGFAETTIADDQNHTLKAGVQAIYVDGLSSAMVSSTGSVLISPVLSEPNLPTFDSPVVKFYNEEFVHSAGVPSGMTLGTGISGSTFTPSDPGTAALTNGGGAQAFLDWNIFNWGTAYVDTKRFGTGVILLRIACTVGQGLGNLKLVLDDGNNVVSTVSIGRVIDDGAMHNYVVPWHGFTFTGPSEVRIRLLLQDLAVGAVLTIDSIALGILGYGTLLDADVDRAIQARNQFVKVQPDGTGSGGGYQLDVPVVQPGTDGRVVLVDSNGIFFTRAGLTKLESSYREGVRGTIGPFSASDVIELNDDGTNSGPAIAGLINPIIPEPVAWNKFRIMVEKKGSTLLAAAPTQYPIGEWIELTDFRYQPTFSVHPYICYFNFQAFQGGILSHYSDQGPWAQSQQKKSALALNGTTTLTTTTATTDAWYDGKGLLPSANVNTIYFRYCPYIKIVTPNVRKPNGMPYWADVEIRQWRSEGTLDAPNNKMNLCTPFPLCSQGGPKIRVMTDGGTYIAPLPISNTVPYVVTRCDTTTHNGAAFYYDQDVVIRWTSFAAESGCPAVNTQFAVSVDRIEWDFLTPNGGQNPISSALSAQMFTYVTYNEH
ncbi:MAG TPA: hypothetical protein VKU62_08775 [Thermoanaerobaculia bacterium]|nr:hypothetical protein [Thermoanaerobaculia bacterium]